jgi:hypothetical protein
MKRGVALALLALATSVVVQAQIHGVPPSVTSFGPGRSTTPGVPASVTSLGPRGFGDFADRRAGGFTFGNHSRFVTSFRSRNFHRHFFPVVVAPYYWPYYGWDYPLDVSDANAYQQPTQPIVIVERRTEDRPADLRSAQPSDPPAPAQEQEPTVLVFRDGHKQEVRNYAIVGQTLWDFSAKGTRKIPLTDLDLDTTRKLNDDRGVEFVLPKS